LSAETKSALQFDGNQAKKWVAHLSTDALQGRMTCTDGYRKAAEWSAARFKEWGLVPAGEEGTYFQKVTIPDFTWSTGAPTLKVGGREFFYDDDDFRVESVSTAGVTIDGEVVFVGYGISKPEKGLNEYDGIDVKGKIALVLKGTPTKAPAQRQMFARSSTSSSSGTASEEDSWKEESTDKYKIKTAYEQGASGVLLFDPDESTDSSSRRRRSSRSSEADAFKPEKSFICMTIKERVVRQIMKQDAQESPRGFGRRLSAMRREIKEKRSQSATTGVRASLKGYDVAVRYDKASGNNSARNVLAKIEGTDPKLKNQYVIVGAHLDHVGVRGGYVYNGADDNASGSAVVLELARLIAASDFRPRRTMLFCLWCGEERGLIGSRHFTKQPCDGVDMKNVVTYFNLDMVGMGEQLRAPGALNFPAIWEVIKREQDPEVLKCIVPSTGGPGGSDHSGFITKGIEALALMSSGGVGHQDYHQPEDDIAKIEPQMLSCAGQFVLQGMMNLANETKVKLVIDRREQLYNGLRMRITNFNPELPESAWSVVKLEQKDSEALQEEIYKQVRTKLKSNSSNNSGESSRSSSSRSSSSRSALSRGLNDLSAIGSDTRLLGLAIDLHGIGRVDVKADDKTWVADGRLSDTGKQILKALEENSVAVRLVSPGEELLSDVTSAATKPFIVTGEYTIPESLVDRLNSRGVMLGINFDPQKVSEFLVRVEESKLRLGQRKNLFAFVTSTEGLEEAKKAVYMGLLDRGWAHNEICGTREIDGLFPNGSFQSLKP
jgi:hypothetical protein